MDETLKKCEKCERLFSGPEGMEECHSCRDAGDVDNLLALVQHAVRVRGRTSLVEITAVTGIGAIDVRRILENSPALAKDVNTGDLCAHCEKRAVVEGRDLCHVCIVDLEADLKDQQESVTQDLVAREERPESRLRYQSVGAALRDKRRRTGSHRFDSTPRNIKRGS